MRSAVFVVMRGGGSFHHCRHVAAAQTSGQLGIRLTQSARVVICTQRVRGLGKKPTLTNSWLCVAVIVAGLSLATAVKAQQEQQQGANPWSQCCGIVPWPMSPGTMGRGMGPMAGSMPRHRQAMMSGVPAPYDGLANPLPRTRETLDRGATVYAENCASCHGPTGRGDGEAGRDLSPPPEDLAWLSQMPMARWDPFMYWTIAEGGTSFGTGMPAFKDTLSSDDIWAVIAYVQARLPQIANPVE